ncbi:MAG: M23 family metallopeptidase [Myxococcaceae bacterium]|nr:M23 family metallopeptidase [Myxococcaceae bacterium]
MFTRQRGGLFDALATALCVWAGLFQTPVGALARSAKAAFFREPLPARPLLAYYSGGTWEAPVVKANAQDWQVPFLPLEGPVLASEGISPLARAVQLVGTQLMPAQRENGAPRDLRALSGALEKASSDLGSEDAAVLSVFAGVDVARFAAERVRADGKALAMENLLARLPPGHEGQGDAASLSLTLATAYALRSPLAAPFRLTSGFGERQHPLTGKRQLHTGVDLAVPEGTVVRAAKDGVVTRASYDRLNGHLVIVDHGRGVTTAYCHNARLEVTVGQHVRAGDRIAESGSTGRSTGPHLHYQLELGQRPVNPLFFQSL